MNKRVRMFFTSIMLVVSVFGLVFGVFAATNQSLGVDNYITFDIGDNIACEIDAVTAIGTSPEVAFDSDHSNAKTLKLKADMNSESGTFTYLSGNTTLDESGKWAPWTEEDPASLSYSADTIYWIYKITNKTDNNIQVRITDINDETLFTINNSMRLFKKFGTSESETPNQTDSGEVEKDQSVYVLIALEAKEVLGRIAQHWNYKIHVTQANASYLRKDWKSQFDQDTRDSITEIVFTGGTGEEYTGAYTGDPIPLGATDKNGTVALKGNESTYPNVNEIKGYISGDTLTVHSKGPIYAPVDSSYLFSIEDENCNYVGFLNLESLILTNFDTTNVIYMTGMINTCDCFGTLNLDELDLSNFDTSNVTNMASMFSSCSSLTSLDLSNFDTSNVTDMSSMFCNCSSLTSLDVSNFDTRNVTYMASMFISCISLTSLDLSNFDTSKVIIMSYMFSDCSSLTSLDLSSFYIKSNCSVTDMLKLQGSGSTTAIETLKTPYYVGVESGIDISSLGLSLDGIAQTTIEAGTSNLTLTKVSFLMMNWKGEIDEATRDKITEINFVGGNGEEYSDEEPDFYFGAPNEEGDEALDESAENQIKGYLENTDTTLIVTSKYPIYAPVDSGYLFSPESEDEQDIGFANLTAIAFDNFDTSNVVYMNNLFNADCGCYDANIDSLDLSSFDTSNVIDMSSMFYLCPALAELDISNFDTRNVTDMSNMFSGCASLAELDVSNFDTRNVTDMSGMFSGCSELTALDVSNFDTRNVTDMLNMFGGCSSLTSLDLSNFDTSRVEYMGHMFHGCSGLTSLDLSSFDTSNVTNMLSMFNGCSGLTSLDLSSFYIKSNCSVTDMLKLQGFGSTTAIETLKTPYYVGKDIAITNLGLSLNGVAKSTITSAEANKILTK